MFDAYKEFADTQIIAKALGFDLQVKCQPKEKFFHYWFLQYQLSQDDYLIITTEHWLEIKEEIEIFTKVIDYVKNQKVNLLKFNEED